MFKSKKEKHAYKQGIKKGRKGGTVWYSRKKSKKSISKTPQKSNKKRKILPIDRDRYLVENRIERYGILPYKVRHSRYSSLSEAQKGGRAIAKQFKDEYVDNPSDWKNVINIYDKRTKKKFKIKNKSKKGA